MPASRHRAGVAALLAYLLVAPGGASAQGIDDKRAEAAALATRLSDQARRIVALDVELRDAQDELEEAAVAVARAEAEHAAATRRQDELRQRLVLQAQDAYVTGGSVTVLRHLVATGADDVTRRAYLRIVTGNDRRLIGELRATREDLADLTRRLEAARSRARSRTNALTEDRAALDRAIGAQKALLAQVNGELARLVAAEQARREAEARAARALAAPTAPGPAAAFTPSNASMPDAEVWACIRQLESGNNYATPGGGAYQFLDSTWQSLGYAGTASTYPPHIQDQAAVQLQARSGWSQWTTAPLCGRPGP